MNPKRKESLRIALQRELEKESKQRRFGSSERLRWLAGELQNYLERWLAFQTLTPGVATARNDDLFAMIEVGTETLAFELRAATKNQCDTEFHLLVRALADVRKGDTMKAERLRPLLADFRKRLEMP